MNDSLAALSLFALALGVTGCKTRAHKETVVLTPLGEVHISGLPRGFDANDPRLVRASNEINRAVGHRVDLHFVTDHMPQYAGYFEALFDSEMMKLAHDLNGYKKSRPERFRKISKSLRKIVFDYDGSRSDARAVFERRKKQVVFTLVGEGIDSNALSSALNSVYLEEQAQRYSRASARAVPAREHADYFDYLCSYAPDQGRERAHELEPQRGRAEAIVRTIEFEPVVRDPELREEVHGRLLLDGEYILESAEREEFARAQGRGSPFRRAEAMWISWFQRNEQKLSPEHRERAIRILFRRSRESGLDTTAFPTFDRAGYGVRQLQAWARAGFPPTKKDGKDDAQGKAFAALVCAEPRRDGLRSYASNTGACHPWYRYMLTDPGRRRQLSGTVLKTRDNRLVRHVVTHAIVAKPGTEQVMALLGDLQRDRRTWMLGARVLGEQVGSGGTDLYEAVYDKAATLFRRSPKDRGIALFWLVAVSGYGRTRVNWKDFAATYGAPIDQRTFAAYMSQGPNAFDNISDVWPALTTFSRWAVIKPHVGAYLRVLEADDHGSPYQVFENIASVMADAREPRDLAKMQSYFKDRARKSPGNERKMRHMLEALDRRLAQARTPKRGA